MHHKSEVRCSEDFKIEQQEGVLRYCVKNPNYTEGDQWALEGLRDIAQLKTRTVVIITDLCENHRMSMDHTQKWTEAKARVQEQNAKKIIPFKKA